MDVFVSLVESRCKVKQETIQEVTVVHLLMGINLIVVWMNQQTPLPLQPLRHKRNRQHAPRIARCSSKYPAVKYTYFIGFNCLCVCTYML